MDVLVRHAPGLTGYTACWQAMQRFTAARDAQTPDEFWCVEHPAVYTQGQAGRAEHLLDAGQTPVVQSDRGGQVTWHGPGQAVLYVLLDLRRLGLGPRALVSVLEQAVVDLLAADGVVAQARSDAPGVYVGGAKVASLGLRIRQGCSYHGLAVNVANDLAPFARINPCGHAGLAVTSLAALGLAADVAASHHRLAGLLAKSLGYTAARSVTGLP
jgi:lipoyl(octanoyl) transferase